MTVAPGPNCPRRTDPKSKSVAAVYMNYRAGNKSVSASEAPRSYFIPTNSLLRLRRTLKVSEDVIDLEDAKLLLELVEEELAVRGRRG